MMEWVTKFRQLTNDGEMMEFLAGEAAPYSIEQNPIMEFAGEVDKDGVHIFEGDIVDYGYESWNAGFLSYTRVIKRDTDGCFRMQGAEIPHNPRMSICGAHSKRIKVIGNVHQNPELLSRLCGDD